MTLEEIERELAKLSSEERVKLASRLRDESPLPEADRDESRPCTCPSCKRPTKRIEIEVESPDWGRVYFLGMLATLCPDKERGRVCEHCGHIFDRNLVPHPVTDRLIKFAFFAISGVVIVGVIVMFVRAAME